MKNFFTTILPNQGTYFVTSIKAKVCRNHPCHSFDEMVRKAHELDAQDYDTFFACASFKEESYIDAEGKLRQRTAKNVGWVKSFWLDIDCGPDKEEKGKGYATINDALAAFSTFVVAIGLSKPHIIFSGGGLHIYWPLTENITKEQWQPVAKQLKALTQSPAIRLIADNSRTSDISSILRPIGTHNYKPGRNGAVVLLKMEGEAINFDMFSQVISKAHEKHCSGSKKPRGVLQLSTTQATFQPETPDNIARVQSALAAINPDCDRDLWRDILFAIHSTGWSCSEEIARSWSKGDFI
jgi:hypothetical protein